MSMFKASIIRSNGKVIRKEDDLTPVIKEYCENQKVKSYDFERTDFDFIVTMDGDVHIYPDDLTPNGTLPFKLGKVTGNLIVHNMRSINPDLIPEQLDGHIIIDVESLMPNQGSAPEQNEDPDGLELLTKNPPSESQTLKKLEGLISDCVEYGYKIDIESILKSMEEEKLKADKYKLRIEYGYSDRQKASVNQNTVFNRFDIYISDDDEDKLNLTASDKATYLTFLLYEDGAPLGPVWMSEDFFNVMKRIYKKLPDKVEDAINGGINDNKYLYVTTLNSYRSEIRTAIKDRLKNNHLVNKFAIEGYKSEPFKIEKSTPEIREQIKELFNLK